MNLVIAEQLRQKAQHARDQIRDLDGLDTAMKPEQLQAVMHLETLEALYTCTAALVESLQKPESAVAFKPCLDRSHGMESTCKLQEGHLGPHQSGVHSWR